MTKAARQLKNRKRHRGQAMVEFVLVSPVLFAIIMGIAEFSLVGYHMMMMNYATREWSRTEAIGGVNDNTDVPYGGKGGDSYRAFVRALNSDQLGNVTLIHVFHVNPNTWQAIGNDDIYFNNQGNIVDSEGDPVSAPYAHSWLPRLRCVGVPSSAFGVEVTYRHHFLTNFFPGQVVTLKEVAYMSLEPQQYLDTKAACKSDS